MAPSHAIPSPSASHPLVYNQQLLPPVNIENSISSVLHKLQSLPICAVQDIKEAYFRLRLAESRERPLVFLMDWEATGGENGQGILTARQPPANWWEWSWTCQSWELAKAGLCWLYVEPKLNYPALSWSS